jgi:hypothetical protein
MYMRSARWIIAAVVGIGVFAGAVAMLRDRNEKGLTHDSELRKEYCEFLLPLTTELDRTYSAYQHWKQNDLSPEVEIIREGNVKARALLRDKAHLVDPSLREDQNKLISHYDRWLEEYDRARVQRVSDPQQPFVFVQSFPRESEKRFRDRAAWVKQRLGGNPCE